MKTKIFYTALTLMILMACSPDEDVATRPKKNPTAGLTKLQLVSITEKELDAAELTEKGRSGRLVIWKDYSRNFPGIYTYETGEQIVEVVEKDDRYIARLRRGKYILELVSPTREIIYEGQRIRPGNVSEKGWKGYNWFEFN